MCCPGGNSDFYPISLSALTKAGLCKWQNQIEFIFTDLESVGFVVSSGLISSLPPFFSFPPFPLFFFLFFLSSFNPYEWFYYPTTHWESWHERRHTLCVGVIFHLCLRVDSPSLSALPCALGGWPVCTASCRLPCPLASWVWPLRGPSRRWEGRIRKVSFPLAGSSQAVVCQRIISIHLLKATTPTR